jgi:F-type H+-transporting ATPase subunit 8
MKKMPQLVPFYFINEVTFAFAIIVLLTYVFSKYVLPRIVSLFVSRLFISTLLDKFGL